MQAETIKDQNPAPTKRPKLSENPQAQAEILRLRAAKMPNGKIAASVDYPEQTVGDFIRKTEAVRNSAPS